MTADAATDFAARCAARWPGFRARATVPARKSELLAGELDGRPVIAKRLAKPSALWAWYLQRELAIYRAFDQTPPPFRVPALVAADEPAGILVLERLPGPPVATQRRPDAALAPPDLDAILALGAQLAAWPGRFPDEPPPPAVRSAMRARLLEDPTAPRDWVHRGLARCARRGFLDADTAQRAGDALAAHDRVAPCHGDLLLRNIVRDRERLGLVDWECAGPHLADWDLALVAIQLAPESRARLAASIGTGARARAFAALCVFALARELAFVSAFPGRATAAPAARLRARISEAAAALAA